MRSGERAMIIVVDEKPKAETGKAEKLNPGHSACIPNSNLRECVNTALLLTPFLQRLVGLFQMWILAFDFPNKIRNIGYSVSFKNFIKWRLEVPKFSPHHIVPQKSGDHGNLESHLHHTVRILLTLPNEGTLRSFMFTPLLPCAYSTPLVGLPSPYFTPFW